MGPLVIGLRQFEDAPKDIGWEPDGSQLATVGYSGTAFISDPKTGGLVRTFERANSPVITAGDRYVVTWTKNGTEVWNPYTGQLLEQSPTPAGGGFWPAVPMLTNLHGKPATASSFTDRAKRSSPLETSPMLFPKSCLELGREKGCSGS